VDTWGALHQAASMNFWAKIWQKVTQFSEKGRIFYDKFPFFQNNCQIVTENCFVFWEGVTTFMSTCYTVKFSGKES
jgi:hypothetical protein